MDKNNESKNDVRKTNEVETTITCPHCGSTDTCPITYGMPADFEKMEEDMKNHKAYMGGCKIPMNNPNYHCFHCKKDF